MKIKNTSKKAAENRKQLLKEREERRAKRTPAPEPEPAPEPVPGFSEDEPAQAPVVSSESETPLDPPPEASQAIARPRIGRPALTPDQKAESKANRRAREQAEREAAALKKAEQAQQLREQLQKQVDQLLSIATETCSRIFEAKMPPSLSEQEKGALVGAWSPVIMEQLDDENISPITMALFITATILVPRATGLVFRKKA